MSFLSTGQVNYKSRVARAETLATRHAFGTELLEFYAQIARFQGELYEELPKLWGKRPRAATNRNIRAELNLPILADPFREFLLLIQAQGPGPLAAHAKTVAHSSTDKRATLLEKFWVNGLAQTPNNGDTNLLEEFVGRAFLLPYAEFMVSGMLPPVLTMAVCRCPRCNSLPLLGVLRQEGDGGKRFLVCSFCSQEWEFRRIFCAQCGEDDEKKLPVYITEKFPHIRVECCDTCKYFLRTVDLTRDGHAVPLVDDLAAIPLGLWADENGYKRIQSNLLGT